MIALNIQGVFFKKNMGKMGYFFFGVIIPPITVRVASINPASGIPVCCIGIFAVVLVTFSC
jgi:hypothetical protein